MFPCMQCTKPKADDGDEEEGGARQSGTPKPKETVKSLTAQIKDMALKFSSAYKQFKPCSGASRSGTKKGQRPYPDFDSTSEGVQYPYVGGVSASSTPAWDFTSSHYPAGRSDPRFAGAYGGDRTPRGPEPASAQVVEEEDEPAEWVAQVEPGIQITFVSLPNGGNGLKRIRFSKEMFNKHQAQRWWGENFDRIMELYNVQRFNLQALNSPPRSDDGQRDSCFSSPRAPSLNKEGTSGSCSNPSTSRGYPSEALAQGSGHHFHAAGPSTEPSRATTSSRDEPSASNASEAEAEWIEQDEPGVFLTIRQLADGTKELRRVRFSRERFGEVDAKSWWDANRERIQSQYL